MPKPNLAIVIPAYRARYLSESLNSLAEQTCHGFRVDVADEGSPESLAGIVGEFVGRMDLVYHRFPENLGRTALVRHWDRAIRLSGEPWVWLFSDDDVADAGCVAALTDDLRRDPSKGKLRRFDLEFIDDRGRRIEREPVFPDELASPVYVEQLLTTLAQPAWFRTWCFRGRCMRRRAGSTIFRTAIVRIAAPGRGSPVTAGCAVSGRRFGFAATAGH